MKGAAPAPKTTEGREKCALISKKTLKTAAINQFPNSYALANAMKHRSTVFVQYPG